MSKKTTAELDSTLAQERGKLLGFIKKRVKRSEDAEDILQDVFVQLVKMYQSIGSIDHVTAWLYKVANNKIIDASRKKRPLLYDDFIPSNQNEEETLNFSDLLLDLGNSTEDQMLGTLIWETLQKALEDMPSEQAQVFIWHEFEDLSFKEIASRTGCSENTLHSRKRYAILFLKQKLKNVYQEL